MRNVFLFLAIALVTQLNLAFAQSNWKPSKNIEIIVGTSAGGAADRSARLVQRILQQMRIDDGVIVVNKPGGSYIPSFIYLNQYSGDGHYIAISPINLVTNRVVGLGVISQSDITPLAQLISDYHVFSVKTDSPIKSAKDAISLLKKDPTSLSIAISPGPGGANHFAAGTIFKAAGIDIKRLKFVAFASGGQSTVSVLGGHADILVSATPSVTPMIESGKMRARAVTSPKRLDGIMSGVPTWKESGIDSEFSNWRGLIGPRGMSVSQIAFWDSTLERMVQTEEWKADLMKNNQVSSYLNSQASKKYLDVQTAELSEIVMALGLAKPVSH